MGYKPVILAQQGDAPPFGRKEAYEGGQQVGQITMYVMISAVVLWGVFKIAAKLFRKCQRTLVV